MSYTIGQKLANFAARLSDLGDNMQETVATLGELLALDPADYSGEERRVIGLGIFRSNGVTWIPQGFFVTPDMYGADGVDDTAAVTSCMATGKCLLDREVLCTDLVISNGFQSTSNGSITYIGADGGDPLIINATNAEFGAISVNANGSHGSPAIIDISGDNNKFSRIYIHNLNSPVGSGTNQGLRTSGSGNTIDTLEQRDLTNTGNANDSMPQGWVDIGFNNYIASVIQRDCTSGVLPNSSTGITRVGSIYQEGMADNGIYMLAGGMKFDSFFYDGDEEPLVIKGDLTGGSVIVSGTAGSIIGFDNAKDVNIDSIQILQNDAGLSPASLFKTRVGNTASGRITIGEIRGFLPKATSLFNCDIGTIEYLSIGKIEVTLNYDTAIFNPLSNFAGLPSCKGFSLGEARIKVVDINDAMTGSEVFQMQIPTTNLLYPSYFGPINFDFVKSNGYERAGAAFRAVSLSNGLIEVSAQNTWQVNVGPYVREWNYLGREVAGGVSGVPAIGTWTKGQDFPLLAATGAPFRTRCTASGTIATYSQGLTATTDGTKNVVLSGTNTELFPGRFITINSVKTMVVKVSGTALTVDDNIAAGGPGLAITYTTPTFASY